MEQDRRRAGVAAVRSLAPRSSGRGESVPVLEISPRYVRFVNNYNVGSALDRLCLVWCGVEDTPRWVDISGHRGTESRTSGDLKLGCNEAVLSRGRIPGIR